jgi:hypothetical protein
MTGSTDAVLALVESLDERVLDRLAQLLAPRLEQYLYSPDGDRWLNARDAATYLGMTVTALHKLTAARAIPFEQDGPDCRLWFRRSELDHWRRGGGSRATRSASTPLPRPREAAS